MDLLGVIGGYTAIFGILFFVQLYTLGKIPFFQRTVFKRFNLGELTFIASSTIITFAFFEVTPL